MCANANERAMTEHDLCAEVQVNVIVPPHPSFVGR
jgi:hypothetical protein